MFTNFRKVKNNKAVVNWIGNKLLETERDGFGYSIMGNKGFYGEKFIGKNIDFETSVGLNKSSDTFYTLPFVEKVRQTFGIPTKCNGGALFHGRISTNKAGLKNTHPINKHGWSLIHNGVVTNHGPTYKMISDNDTEHLVEHLATGGISSLVKNLTGYYAAGAFDPSGNLHIVRDNIAWLYVAKLPDLDTMIFATTATLIEEFCIEFEFERSTIEQVKSDVYMVFNNKGQLESLNPIESRGYDRTEASYMSKSLSYMGDTGLFSEHYESEMGSVVDASTPKNDDQMNDYESYRTEIEKCMDASYTVYDWNSRTMPVSDFLKLDETSQNECTICRPDGTLLTYEDYHKDRLASEYLPNKSGMY
jgi:hypothetical protein